MKIIRLEEGGVWDYALGSCSKLIDIADEIRKYMDETKKNTPLKENLIVVIFDEDDFNMGSLIKKFNKRGFEVTDASKIMKEIFEIERDMTVSNTDTDMIFDYEDVLKKLISNGAIKKQQQK